MPREEDLPPSKGGRLAEEVTKETKRFSDFIGDSVFFSSMTDKKRLDFVVTHMNKNNAIYNLVIEDLKERLKKLEDEIL
jgi:hypothetical protein